MATFFSCLAGAAMLDSATFEDVESDRSATIQAMGVVLLSSLAAGGGAMGPAATRPVTAVTISVLAFAVWALWAYLAVEIGARLMPARQTRADLGQLLRTTEFASAPGILRIFGIFPGMTLPVFALTAVRMLAAMVVGIRQALDYTSTIRAVVVCSLTWLLSVGLAYAVGTLFVPALY